MDKQVKYYLKETITNLFALVAQYSDGPEEQQEFEDWVRTEILADELKKEKV